MSGTVPKCPTCKGVVKPDIVFFGEELPRHFFKYLTDFPLADLLIIMGTSLEVSTTSFKPHHVPVIWHISNCHMMLGWEVTWGTVQLAFLPFISLQWTVIGKYDMQQSWNWTGLVHYENQCGRSFILCARNLSLSAGLRYSNFKPLLLILLLLCRWSPSPVWQEPCAAQFPVCSSTETQWGRLPGAAGLKTSCSWGMWSAACRPWSTPLAGLKSWTLW